MSISQSPMLSVCIPTYNRANWLRVCLLALSPMIQQSAGLVEVVVSDNCSPDDGKTAKVIKEIQKICPVRYFRQKSNISVNPNILYTVNEMARGEYIWVIGDDDVVCNNGVGRILSCLQHHQDLDFVFVNHIGYITPEPLSGPIPAYCITVNNRDFSDRYLEELNQIVVLDANCFTAIYNLVLRRSLATQVYRVVDTDSPLFSNIFTIAPHAAYIIKNLLYKPAWYIGKPVLMAGASPTWKSYEPAFYLVLMHDLYDLLEEAGVDAGLMDRTRRQRIRYSGDMLWQMLTDPNAGLRDRFSLWEYQKRHGRYPELWQMMSEVVQRQEAPAILELAKAA